MGSASVTHHAAIGLPTAAIRHADSAVPSAFSSDVVVCVSTEPSED